MIKMRKANRKMTFMLHRFRPLLLSVMYRTKLHEERIHCLCGSQPLQGHATEVRSAARARPSALIGCSPRSRDRTARIRASSAVLCSVAFWHNAVAKVGGKGNAYVQLQMCVGKETCQGRTKEDSIILTGHYATPLDKQH